MTDWKLLKKEFEELEQSIERLKRAQRELDELSVPEDTCGSQIESIRSKIYDPHRVVTVEQELVELKRQVAEPEIPLPSATDASPDYGATVDISVFQPELSLPDELAALYYDDSFIGSGGFANVFQAKRKSDGTLVAVKVPERLDAKTGRSFISEITSWRRLDHRNIASLHDFNILPIPYLEMELCQKSLSELPVPLDPGQAAALVYHIAEGLRYAHSQGIIHRDLKPHNVLLQGEVPKIVDWGVSKVIAETRSTGSHTFSPYWASPEQLSPQRFGKPDHRTDIYQLGVVFYELVTGKLPYKGGNITETMGQIIMEESNPPSLHNPIAKSVEPIIMKCLQRNMDDRYQTVEDMQQALVEYVTDQYNESLANTQGKKSYSGYYGAELCLFHLIRDNIGDALKYATDLKQYVSGGSASNLENMISEIEQCSADGSVLSEEQIERAFIVLQQAKMG